MWIWIIGLGALAFAMGSPRTKRPEEPPRPRPTAPIVFTRGGFDFRLFTWDFDGPNSPEFHGFGQGKGGNVMVRTGPGNHLIRDWDILWPKGGIRGTPPRLHSLSDGVREADAWLRGERELRG